jgi:hypothetical protein
MKTSRTVVFAGALSLSLAFAGISAGGDAHGAAPEGAGATANPLLAGTVLEVTNASRYTYVLLDTGTKKVWAAGPKVVVKVGDRVSLAGSMPNKNFFSAALNKTFDEIYFAEAITPAGSAKAAAAGAASSKPAGLDATTKSGKSAATVIEAVQKPEGGKTVAEIWAGKDALAGKQVIVRGIAVKAIPNVMGKTFLHLRDGTGGEGMNDLSVTTTNEVKTGMIITLSGLVVTNKDFGAGYKYDVILEDAAVIAK